MNEEQKLKPVTFIKGGYGDNYYSANLAKQNLLLKAMAISSDPKDWKMAIGAKHMAEVYRTLDKLSIRKEYHQALVRQGISLDFIIGGVKKIAENAKDKTALAAFQTLLKSVGMDKYEDVKAETRGWEDLILDANKKADEDETKGIEKSKVIESSDYTVVEPKMPQEILDKQAAEQELADGLYGKK